MAADEYQTGVLIEALVRSHCTIQYLNTWPGIEKGDRIALEALKEDTINYFNEIVQLLGGISVCTSTNDGLPTKGVIVGMVLKDADFIYTFLSHESDAVEKLSGPPEVLKQRYNAYRILYE